MTDFCFSFSARENAKLPGIDDCVGNSQVALANLDAVLLESRGTFEMLPEHVLAQLEEMQRLQNPRASASPQADSECLRPPWCSVWG